MSSLAHPDAADSWNELDGVWSVERDDGVWQLRLEDAELLVSRGRVEEDRTDWWVSLRRDGEPIVGDHRVRVRADSDLGEALAAVLTTIM